MAKNAGGLINIVVCGTGIQSQILYTFACSRTNFKVCLLVLDMKEAMTLSRNISELKPFLRVKQDEKSYKDIPFDLRVSTNFEETISEADLIVLSYPFSDHEDYLHIIVAHIQPGTIIVGMPGGPGFEQLCKFVLGEKFKTANLASCDGYPWDFTMSPNGKIVEIHRNFRFLLCSLFSKYKPKKPAFYCLQELFGQKPSLKPVTNYLAINILSNYLGMFRPVIIYSEWKSKTTCEKQLFMFRNIAQETAELVTKISDEILSVAAALRDLKSNLDFSDVKPFVQWMKPRYDDVIIDATDVSSSVKNNESLHDEKQPMCRDKDHGKHVLDIENRDIEENLLYGILAVRALAQIVAAPTPEIDNVIRWYEQKLDKDYLGENGDLTGPDNYLIRSPQKFGIMTIDQLHPL